jgi:hypothetical protein
MSAISEAHRRFFITAAEEIERAVAEQTDPRRRIRTYDSRRLPASSLGEAVATAAEAKPWTG